MVVMESLALGIPVVAPNFGPFPFLVEHQKNGLLFEPDSVEDLAAKLDELLDDEALYADLRAGAKKSGDALLIPPLTFAQAVACAFRIAPSELENMPA
jgi:glycosyltransferase involved in cell wall biosynthesis